MASPEEFRPPPPPAYDSPEREAEMAELRAFARTPKTNADALFWEYGSGGTRNYQFWNGHLSRLVLEEGEARNAPRVARAHALANAAIYDAGVACWDAKYAYWTIRPSQLDREFRATFTASNHPSYPSALSCFSTAAAEVIGHLFPRDAAALTALSREGGESRIWSGIHYRSDMTSGQRIGEQVAGRGIERARADDAARAAR